MRISLKLFIISSSKLTNIVLWDEIEIWVLWFQNQTSRRTPTWVPLFILNGKRLSHRNDLHSPFYNNFDPYLFSKVQTSWHLKNAFHFLSIIAHGLILSNPLSEYTYSVARISGVCILLMSCINEQEDTSELVYLSHWNAWKTAPQRLHFKKIWHHALLQVIFSQKYLFFKCSLVHEKISWSKAWCPITIKGKR